MFSPLFPSHGGDRKSRRDLISLIPSQKPLGFSSPSYDHWLPQQLSQPSWLNLEFLPTVFPAEGTFWCRNLGPQSGLAPLSLEAEIPCRAWKIWLYHLSCQSTAQTHTFFCTLLGSLAQQNPHCFVWQTLSWLIYEHKFNCYLMVTIITVAISIIPCIYNNHHSQTASECPNLPLPEIVWAESV